MDSSRSAADSGWEGFRRLGFEERRRFLREAAEPAPEEWESWSGPPSLLELADLMVESAVGLLPVPVGIAAGFLIDGERVNVPMAVEEPSVIAAASFAGRLLRRAGGLATWATEPVMTAQVFLEEVPEGREQRLFERQEEIGAEVDRLLPSMKARGGGFRGLEAARLGILRPGGAPPGGSAPAGDLAAPPAAGTNAPPAASPAAPPVAAPAASPVAPPVLSVRLRIDVRDAMGANVLNTAAEGIRGTLERLTGGRAVMAILSNAARERRAGARFRLPVGRLDPLAPAGMDGAEVARRVVLAARIASEDPDRAVTHNKGILNGISSVALATFNDTRAVEAAAHAWAGRDGRYRPLSEYRLSAGVLEGSLELPLALGTVGGAVRFHPASRLALRILGHPDSRRLCRIAAAVGLAQNLAALLALVTEGIQRGHMKYHAARLAWAAGARGPEVRRVVRLMDRASVFTAEEARRALRAVRGEEQS